MRWVWMLLQCNWKHSVLLTRSKNLLHPSITGQMFSEALSFTPRVGPIPHKINSLPIPLASTTKALVKANWIVCGPYAEAIKPKSVFLRTRDVVVDGRSLGTICTPWPHLIRPLDPQSFPIQRTSVHSTLCIRALRGTITLNKHQNRLLLWLISFWIPAE